MAIYAIILFERMATRSDNKNETYTISTSESLNQPFGETGIKYLIMLYDTENFRPVEYDEEMKRYITV